VVVIPVAIGVPTVIVFIPPAVIRRPAVLASLSQIVARVVCLPAVPAVVLNGFVEFVICFRQPMLALGLVRSYARRAGEDQNCSQRSASQNQLPEFHQPCTTVCFHLVLL
jgi:hypothetical protein